MDTGTMQILDTITTHLGEPLSINQLTEKIKEKYGKAYYANIYRKIKQLNNEHLITTEHFGKSRIIKPNFQNYLIIDYLSEMETEKKINFIKGKSELIEILRNLNKITEILGNQCLIKSISSIDTAKNSELNRLELLFLAGETIAYQDAIPKLYEAISELENKYNLKIDSLIINENDFSSLIRSDEINPLREAVARKTILFCPEAFWSQMKEIAEKTDIRFLSTETKLNKISDEEIIFNLYRFGYKEFGSTFLETKKYCIEYIITALVLRNDARWLEAIPIILAKNDFRPNLLSFLSQKYRTSGKLMGLLKVLQSIKPSNKINDTIIILETFREEEKPANEESIRRKMRLYNALR
jgi:hypothetical protein